jgi:hypothetical protein
VFEVKKTAATLAIVLSLTVAIATNAFAEDTLPAPAGSERSRSDSYLLQFADIGTSGNESGYIKSYKGTSSGKTFKYYNAVLPNCGQKYKFGCIQSIEVKRSSETAWEVLKPGAKFFNDPIASWSPNPDGTRDNNLWSTWVGDEGKGLPPSEKVQLYDSTLHTHGGGNSYVIKALMSGGEESPGKFILSEFGLSITPVEILGYDPKIVGSKEVVTVIDYLFPKDLEFRFTVKLGGLYSQVNGWFFGRVTDAEIDLNAKSKTLIVRGSPSTTPVQSGYMPYPVPDAFKEYFGSGTDTASGNLPTQVFSPTFSVFGNPIENWLKYKPYLNQRASFEPEVWKIDVAPKSNYKVSNDFQNCLDKKSGISGLLTTNATVYDPNPPSWSAKDATLTYQVAGPELLSDGSKNRGNYLLAIRADVASCLWKSDLKNAKATVEVTNGDGTAGAQIATTSLSQKNGWLYFSATGFHFSAPKIKVKLVPAKVFKITCVKGKAIKTVAGTAPKCPTGYQS